MGMDRATKRAPGEFRAALDRERSALVHRLRTATDPRAVHVRDTGAPPRTIAISARGRTGQIRFELSAGDAAELMFQIGYALERAACDGTRPRHGCSASL